ncbi:MAG: hypothetical protein EA350_08205 [Gemmatimonadales bacterium]|nr:MAG: hypothetical protein EA350_08205 [Gemmatimonadales bacterium]
MVLPLVEWTYRSDASPLVDSHDDHSRGAPMRTVASRPLIILGGLLLLSAACASPVPDTAPEPDPTPGLSSHDETAAEVAAFLDQYLAAMDARDADFIRAASVDDGRFVWIEDGEVRYRSAEEILAGLNAFPADVVLRTELSNLEVVPLGGGGAHAWAAFTTMVGTGAGSFSFGGAINLVVERGAGSWKLVGGHTSSPAPAAR